MEKPIKVAIFDQYQLLREALRQLISKRKDMSVVAEADTGFQALEIAKRTAADVIVLEPHLPEKDGLDLTCDLLSLDPKRAILILSVDTTPHSALRLLRAGAMGWLPKTAGCEEVVQAIQGISMGRPYLPEPLKKLFAEKLIRPGMPEDPMERLSNREFQVMRLIATGKTNREIGQLLFIGIKTVDTHRSNLLKKLGLRHNVDLARYALKMGVVGL